MPTTYTHYYFGEKVLNKLPRETVDLINKNRKLYDIGVHGPDILFYNKSPFRDRVRNTGTGLHHQSAKSFFKNAAKVIQEADDKNAAKAYLYGFITHFVFDSECHKYVEKMIYESGVGHHEIEAEFDAYLLKKKGEEPTKYNRVVHLKSSPKKSRVIAPFFNNIFVKGVTKKDKRLNIITPSDISKSISSQIIFHRILTPRTLAGRRLICAITELLGGKDGIRGLIINETSNPKCSRYNYILEEVCVGGIPIAVDLIRGFQEFVHNGENFPSGFDKTYDQGEHWMDVILN